MIDSVILCSVTMGVKKKKDRNKAARKTHAINSPS